MAAMDAALAVVRFGLGARPGEIAALEQDPQGALMAQLRKPMPFEGSGLPSSAAAFRDFAAMVKDRKALKADAKSDPDADPVKALGKALIPAYRAEVEARTRHAVATTTPFHERLVAFWSNHFTVSIQNKLVVAPLAGSFEREAIRPNIMGSFHDLLLAAERHPAMLLYLDNAQSVGPDSRVGQRRDKGLNENLAREALELHTVGVDGGYTQADVTAFANVLTGWTVMPQKLDRARAGEFTFLNPIHEGMAQTVLGRRYAEDGEAQGLAVFADLARHPATAKHIATKLARHFIADDPPEACVARLTAMFRQTDGDLPSLYRALIDSPEAWQMPLSKIKSPNAFLISAWRGLTLEGASDHAPEAYAVLGQKPFFAPSPAGWPDANAAWTGSDALNTRLDYAHTLATRTGGAHTPDLGDTLLGDLLSTRTSIALSRAADAVQALTLLLMSPEFQRR